MFNNVGSKCQNLATAVCWIGIIASIIAGCVMLFSGAVLAGLAEIALGCLFSWLGSLSLYAIGETAERVEIMQGELATLKKSLSDLRAETDASRQTTAQPASASYSLSTLNVQTGPKTACPHCGAMNRISNKTCFACGRPMDE